MEPAKFRIYYDDGSTYSADPFYAPSTGAQVIAQEQPSRTRGFGLILLRGKDVYCYKDGCWFATTETGMWDYLMEYLGPQKTVFGRMMVRDEEYWAVVNRAKKEGLG